MHHIRPISDLRNKAQEISALVHESREPVFITKNGEGDMVVMSLGHYDQMLTRINLLTKLAVAQAERASGSEGRPYKDVMRSLREKLPHVA